MKERPIIFKDEAVRAILNATKTQTRRVVKPTGKHWQYDKAEYTDGHMTFPGEEYIDESLCPYGKPGDRLWVREAWFDNLCPRTTGDRNDGILYRADGTPDFEGEENLIRWRSSTHMPRWASRITLEITGVRVERLQDISEADAKAEGVPCWANGDDIATGNYLNRPLSNIWCEKCDGEGGHEALGRNCGVTYVDCTECDTSTKLFRNLWQSKGPGSWDANPWVWVIEFKRVQP